MTRKEVFDAIENERSYQNGKWGNDFDEKNTPNDWVAYISKYLGQSVTMPFDVEKFRTQILKVATLCTAALEQTDYSARHYDRDNGNGRVG